MGDDPLVSVKSELFQQMFFRRDVPPSGHSRVSLDARSCLDDGSFSVLINSPTEASVRHKHGQREALSSAFVAETPSGFNKVSLLFSVSFSRPQQ